MVSTLGKQEKSEGPTLCLFLVHSIISFVPFLELRTKQNKNLSEKVNEFDKENGTHNQQRSFNLCSPAFYISAFRDRGVARPFTKPLPESTGLGPSESS